MEFPEGAQGLAALVGCRLVLTPWLDRLDQTLIKLHSLILEGSSSIFLYDFLIIVRINIRSDKVVYTP